MPKMKYVSVSSDDVASVSDVMQLILRLPYRAACQLAEAIQGDVDKMIDGADAWCEADDEEVKIDE